MLITRSWCDTTIIFKSKYSNNPQISGPPITPIPHPPLQPLSQLLQYSCHLETCNNNPCSKTRLTT